MKFKPTWRKSGEEGYYVLDTTYLDGVYNRLTDPNFYDSEIVNSFLNLINYSMKRKFDLEFLIDPDDDPDFILLKQFENNLTTKTLFKNVLKWLEKIKPDLKQLELFHWKFLISQEKQIKNGVDFLTAYHDMFSNGAIYQWYCPRNEKNIMIRVTKYDSIDFSRDGKEWFSNSSLLFRDGLIISSFKKIDKEINNFSITFSKDQLENENNRYDFIINKVDKSLLEELLIKFKYNKVQIAKYLGITRNTLSKKLKQCELI